MIRILHLLIICSICFIYTPIQAQSNDTLIKQGVTDQNLFSKSEIALDSLKKVTVGYPVAPFQDTLFYIYTTFGPFKAEARAKAINEKIQALYESGFEPSDSLTVLNAGYSWDVIKDDLTLLSITAEDARWMDQSQESLAKLYANKIQNSLVNEKAENSLKSYLIKGALALFILFIAYLIIRLINKLFRWTTLKIHQAKGTWLKGYSIKNYEIITVEREVAILLIANRILKVLTIILIIYLSLPLLFSLFPFTEGFAEQLFSYILNPLSNAFRAFVNYIPNLISIIVILFIVKYALKLIKFLADEIEHKKLEIPGFYPDWAQPTYSILKIFIYAFTLVLIFPLLPMNDSDIFKGVSVFLGILFSLGSSSAIANMVAGLVITYMRPFKLGDRVKIGDITGDVQEKNLLVTRIKTIKNEVITIPNSAILSGHTINYSRSAEEHGLILHTTVTIGYDVPWKQVHELLLNAAKATKHISKDKAPFVLQTSLDDFYVSYQLNAYTTKAQGMVHIYSELHAHIQDNFNEANVEIMSPHYSTLRDGSMTTIPENYLPKDYVVPPFRVKNVDKDSKD